MHIALYSYNVADRKQMERLMEREADKWIKEGKPIYLFTFGSVESLLASTLIYDAVMIDLCEVDTITPDSLVMKYRQEGFATRVIECGEKRTVSEDEGSFFLPKPLRPDDIHSVMLEVEKLKSQDESRIELRTDAETVYVVEEDIMYALQNSHKIDVYLKDGRIVSMHGRLQVFYDEIETVNPTFVLAAQGILINVRYVDKLRLNRAHMADGKVFTVGVRVISYIKSALELLHDGSSEAMEKLNKLSQK